MLGVKQEALAVELGEDWTQKKVSVLEQQEVIEAELLSQVAQVLKVPEEAIKNFDEEAAVTYFNTFNDNSFSNSSGVFHAYNCTFNPLDKLMEALEENKKLYERLLESEREKIEILKEKKTI